MNLLSCFFGGQKVGKLDKISGFFNRFLKDKNKQNDKKGKRKCKAREEKRKEFFSIGTM